MNKFNIKTKIFFGENAISNIKDLHIKNVCIVCDKFIVSAGIIDKLTKVLKEGGIEYRIFSDVVPDPPIEVVAMGLKEAMAQKPDAIIAFGGGSAIDTAKAISFMYTRVAQAEKPLCITIPTTSGTGSEVTSFSVITDKKHERKIALSDESMLPAIAILEPEFVRSVPPAITADTGMDVLTHALEAYVSLHNDDFGNAFAEKAVRFVFKYLYSAFLMPDDMIARSKMHNASCMAGMAFNHAGLGINHSLAHALGGAFHIPHGRSNAILMPYVIAYNAGEFHKGIEPTRVAKRYAFMAGLMGLPNETTKEGVHSLIYAIRVLLRQLNIKDNIKSHGINESDFLSRIDHMVNLALNDSCTATNPRVPTAEGLREVYLKAYHGVD